MNDINPRPLIIANWKMNLLVADTVKLVKLLVKSAAHESLAAELVLCPAFPALAHVKELIKKTDIALGAQDVFWKNMGPYTGEISPAVLKELGVTYVLVGHSERRNYLKETEPMIHHKVLTCLTEGLIPVICVGETLTERQQGNKDLVVWQQVKSALAGVQLAAHQRVIIAYEPVWVIGSGQAVNYSDAAQAAQVIKEALFDLLSTKAVTDNFRIIYGGSVDSSNARDFARGDILSGILVGSASLRVAQLMNIIRTVG